MAHISKMTIVSYRLTGNTDIRDVDAQIEMALGQRSEGSGCGMGWRDLEFYGMRHHTDVIMRRLAPLKLEVEVAR